MALGAQSKNSKGLVLLETLFFNTNRPQIETIDRAASRFQLFGNSKKEDERTFRWVFMLFLRNTALGVIGVVTTVVYAVEQWPEPGAPADGRFKVASRGEHKFDVTLHKLQVYTTAT